MGTPASRLPPLPGGLGRAVGLVGTAAGLAYGVALSLFNVEGGHRAIVFNRFQGIKSEASGGPAPRPWPGRLSTECTRRPRRPRASPPPPAGRGSVRA